VRPLGGLGAIGQGTLLAIVVFAELFLETP
jgi:hypothetical protein